MKQTLQRIGYVAFLGAACLGMASLQAIAGGGPENVLLVVNANSQDSKTIANHYIRLRKIPPLNVLSLDWQGSVEFCSGKKFLEKILTPVLEAIRDRRLVHQIDYVVYSSDFPWRVDIRGLFSKEEKFPAIYKPIASLTGATYLWQYLEAKSQAVVMPNSNWYVPKSGKNNQGRCAGVGQVVSRGFRSRYGWTQEGQRAPDPKNGQHYFLSTMLGVTSGRGNTVKEVLLYLGRSVGADATQPRGTVYFMYNGDVRSKTRDACYPEMVSVLMRRGVPARRVKGVLPKYAPDIIGLMTGSAKVDLDKASIKILPGAICEHLTSLGGVLRKDGGQTPLTDFLRHGAAGASGTVAEPYAIQAKFPLPSLHLHYLRGCSLAEAFYQSVAGPYQLLIVGDPLCQPWAKPPKISVRDLEPGQPVQGTISIQPSSTASLGHRAALFEYFMDGRLVARSRPGQTIPLNTTKLSDGHHELRIVGIEGSPIETQGRLIVPLLVNNRKGSLDLKVQPQGILPSTSTVKLSASQPGAQAITFFQNNRELARVEGEKAEFSIAASSLGLGPVTFWAASEGGTPAQAAPVTIHVQ